MAKHGVSDICSTARSWALAALILIILQVSSAQRVRVDAEVRAFAKESVLLRCMFVTPGNTKLTQVSWIKEAKEGTERINVAVFHPQYGESFPNPDFRGRVKFTQASLDNPSIEMSNLRMADEGKYTCEYATYPSGNEQGTTNLLMLAKPKNSAQHLTVTEGKAAVVVARCEAAEGKPAAVITWESDVAGGKDNTTQVPQADGTVTVKSEYWLTPTPSHNNRDVKCVVTQTTQDKPQFFPMKLSIQYPPKVSIVGYDDNWYMGRTDAVLVCQHDANPLPTTIDWTVASGALPDAVEVSGDRLLVKKVDDSVNTTFVCEVKNTLGSAKSQLTAVVIEKRKPPRGNATGAIIGGIIGVVIFLCLIGALIFLLRKRQLNAENDDAPPKHKPPPPVKMGSSTEMLNKPHNPSTETQPLSHIYYETGGEPVTDLDDEGQDGAPANGSGPALWDSSATNMPADNHATADDSYPEGPEPPLPNSGATVARGESFMSEPMLV
ncbi:PVR cell adhesion molecule related 2 like isoform X1 [Alosa pseudoharengus]|uniref:PVR cell adhesion molecule related 2 like isoform X1 n=1 Tax=Alosa pseudoharengus TaxID=34774 RepID=UPI003F8A5EBE